MTPDQKFTRWIKISCSVFLALFVYFLIADLAMPVTPQAMATRVTTKVAPRVSGQITNIYVHNNQVVHKGDVLFEIDPQQYELAVEKAKLNLETVKQNNAQLDASIAAARADVVAAETTLAQRQREANRLDTLFNRKGTSQQLRDDAVSEATAAKANLLASKARLKQLIVSRGDTSDNNINIRVARNELDSAILNLSYTQAVAESDGIVTNLQLESGTYTAAGTPLVALVSNKVDVIADFREKSLRHFTTDSKALVAFDSKPGQVFEAAVSSIDAGVSDGQIEANGRLAAPTTSNRWVRDAQRMRLHVDILESDVAGNMPSGARASVQLVPDGFFFGFLARVQIRFLSILHYIY